MVEIVNLKRARKQQARTEKEKTAQANRILHGTPTPVRKLARAKADKAARALARHKLED